MKYSGTLLAVRDINRARKLYEGLLGCVVAMDLGACLHSRDLAARGAVHARLMRVGNRSLTAIWDRSPPG